MDFPKVFLNKPSNNTLKRLKALFVQKKHKQIVYLTKN